MPEASLDIVVDPKGAKSGASASSRAILGIGRSANRMQASIGRAMRGVGASIGRTARSIISVRGAIAALAGAAGVGLLTKSFLEAASTTEDLTTRFVSLTKSEELAQAKMQVLADFAAKAPFELPQIVEAGVTIEAFGGKSDQLIRQLGDLAAFMGVGIVEASQAMGRALAAGAGAADVLRERGILQLVKENVKAKKGIEDLSKLTLPEFRQSLIDTVSDPDGKIFGATERLRETLTGAISTASDAVFNFRQTIGNELLPAFKEINEAKIIIFNDLTASIKENRAEVREFASVSIVAFIDAIILTIRAGEQFVSILKVSKDAVKSLGDAVTKITFLDDVFMVATEAARQYFGAQEDINQSGIETVSTVDQLVVNLERLQARLLALPPITDNVIKSQEDLQAVLSAQDKKTEFKIQLAAEDPGEILKALKVADDERRKLATRQLIEGVESAVFLREVTKTQAEERLKKEMEVNEQLRKIRLRTMEAQGLDAEAGLERMQARNEREIEFLKELGVSKNEILEAETAQELERIATIEDMERQALLSRLDSSRQAFSALGSLSNSLVQVTGKNTGILFALNKTAATANAIINTAEGVTRALSSPFPLNIILPPIVAAAGMAQVAAITATSLGSKGGVPIPSLGGRGGDVTRGGPSPVPAITDPARRREVTIVVNGNVLNNEAFGRQTDDLLVDLENERV